MAQTPYPVSFGDNNSNRGNTTGSFNTFYMSDEDARIMRWLSPLEPNIRHQGVRTDRFDGVGDWLLETTEFREWRDGEGGADKAVLFCSGNPGVGKTYLSSLVIDSLCDQAQGGDTVVAGFYCDFPSQQEQTTTNMMGAILKQLVGRGGVMKDLQEAFQKAKEEVGGRGPRLEDVMEMLRTAIASLPRAFICIDALDECLPKWLHELLESLRDIVRVSPNTRVFLTGRPHIKEDVQRYFSKAVVIPICPNMDDIRNYLEMRLDMDCEPGAMNNDLRADIVRVMLEKMADLFLLVSISMDDILAEVTIRERRKKLYQIAQGNGLGDTYTATLTRLRAQKGYKSALGLKVLMWVLHSERPLRAQELCHALGVEIGSVDLDLENVPALRTLVSSCLGLVTVEAPSSTVRLVHFTLQEHLFSDPTLFHSPHSAIAEVCLTYLNSKCIRDLSAMLDSAPSTMPLLEYASVYWGEHARKGITEAVKILALRLLDRFDEHISAQLLLLHYNRDSRHFYGAGGPKGFTGLHGAAFLGIAEIFYTVLKMKEWDINANDGVGLTAIALAARSGHEEAVKMLLEREDVDLNKPDNRDQTPLFGAAWDGHEGVVKLLLEREDVDPNKPDNRDQTPLFGASWNGHEGVVKLLLEREDVYPNKPDNRGQTPLFGASWNGHEGAVKILLELEDVNLNKQDNRGQTPLYCAALTGHDGVVKILLGHDDVNPDKPDVYGQTPLFGAASNGHERVVEVLLRRDDVNPNKSNKYGQTPLFGAAWDGHEGVVKILLGHDDINPGKLDKSGRTPLWWAAKSGHAGVVALLQFLTSTTSSAS